MKKKLSLDGFKAKSSKRTDSQNLTILTGGILGACHCETVYAGTLVSTVCYYLKK